MTTDALRLGGNWSGGTSAGRLALSFASPRAQIPSREHIEPSDTERRLLAWADAGHSRAARTVTQCLRLPAA